MDHIETKILNSYTIQEAAQNMVFAARLPCGSASINNTFFPCLANPTPRFKVVVLFATPPFWFATEITLHILFSSI